MRSKSKIIFICSISTLIVISILTFITCIIITPKIELIEPNITIAVGTPYEEPGYKAYMKNHDISEQVKILGQVNTDKLGTYYLSYQINKLLFSTQKIRIIKVVDEIAPTLTLKGESEVFLCPKSTYQEEGYEAIDNYDLDLTSQVKRNELPNLITYEVVDSSNNKTIKERKIYYQDQEKPKLQLLGDQTKTIYLNSSYQEDGYKAIDNCDGDLTSKVIVNNDLNTSKLGTYKITYQVSDSSGNKITVNRIIKVINKINTTNQKGVIYLTFDDGPSSTITGAVLDILKEEQVPATFFVINHSDNLNYLIKREYQEGHTVALHSYTHNYSNIYKSKTNYFNDLKQIQEKVLKITGETSKIIRFPGGSSNTISKKYQKGIMSSLTKEVVEQGYHYFDWNISSGDAGNVKSSEEVYRNVTSNLSYQRINVVLMHDFENNYYTLNALKNIIKYGKENGYTFKKITLDTPMVTHSVAN